MSEEDRLSLVMERRYARHTGEEDIKTARETTERDTESSLERFEELLDGMSPEEASAVLDAIGGQ
jgi:muramoyltetrapeptide carboxypeptidase LdcA involved in peptidoglycan recycling